MKILFILLLCFLASVCHGSPLGDLAASMKAGQWAELTTSNISNTLKTSGASRMTFGYTEDIKWDPTSRGLWYIGGDHFHPPGGYPKFINFDEATNTWKELTRPNWFPYHDEGAMHGYDHTAINPALGVLYHRPNTAKRMIHQYVIASDWWRVASTLPTSVVASDADLACCIGMEFFPEMKGLIQCNGDNGGIYFFGTTTGKWQELAKGLTMASYHNFAEYNPVHKVMICGGGNGSNDLYKIDGAGKVTTLNKAPVTVGVQSAMHTVDPVSGDYLIFTRGGQFYVYDVTSDSWQQKSGSIPIWTTVYNNSVHGVVATPVSTHGVVLFVKCSYENCTVYLYKHAEGSAVEGLAHGEGAGIDVFPNPFNPAVTILINWNNVGAAFIKSEHNILRTPPLQLSIYDIHGRKIHCLNMINGRYTWNPANQPAGIYILKAEIGNQKYSRKLFLQK
jgi:hypothetical protein